MKYIEIQVATTTEASDAISNIMYEAGAAGVVIEDPNDFIQLNKDKKHWDYVDEALVSSLGTDVRVKGYFNEIDYDNELFLGISERVRQIPEFGLELGKGDISTKEVHEEDWATAWKQYYKPSKIGDRVVVKPTWEEYEVEKDEVVIELDPGMAFGTGTHETTIMCVKFIENYLKKDGIVFDVGCGSGILGITAAKLGAGKVLCVDIDEVSCKVSRENTQINKVTDLVEVRSGNLLDVVNEKADLIIANIIADIIIDFSEEVGRFLNKDGVFIASGIIKDRRDEVLDKLKAVGLDIIEIQEMGEWCAIASGVERK